jgi:5-methyltetrahydrofolate--homocysteine methyltransferase
VGVVLGCNNYEVIDLGVMVPANRIISAAMEQKVDIVGLSGLITPSLEEMAHVASEMERTGMEIPLLIGGATTSEIHTAVKIAPQYRQPVIHVKDASRSSGVISRLLSADRDKYTGEMEGKYEALRQKHEGKKRSKVLISLDEARNNRLDAPWQNAETTRPSFFGCREVAGISIEEISRYIDWTFFFHAWRIPGKFPAIFNDPVKGEEARKLYDDASELLRWIIEEKALTAKGVLGFYPARSAGDDTHLYADESGSKPLRTLCFLRNQEKKEKGVPNLCLSDFVAPAASGKLDYIGLFAVTAGIGIERWVERFEKENDDYRSFMLKILADRLAEAFAEWLHLRVRKEHWGYVPSENLEIEQILKEQYQGIRPAPGYPACPEHSEKRKLFDLLGAKIFNIKLL